MIDRLPAPLRCVLDWQRRQFFREEEWQTAGPAHVDAFVRTVEDAADNGLPLLMTLPKFRSDSAFIGRIRDGRNALKHRTRPLIWLIGPGSYYYSGRLDEAEGGGLIVRGGYRPRPTLAIMYYVYLTPGFTFLGLSIPATLAGTAAWIALDGISPVILLAGLKMLAISTGYLALGRGHITIEKWLDGRNRLAVQTLLDRAAGKA